ncbi:MAG: YeeE/YedE thiosulfate transporter family protein [Pseudomonadota bacterium]
METAFTPLASLGGGLLIGLSAVLLMLGLGRIFGATGILSGAVFVESREELRWRAALILGMILAPGLIFAFTGSTPALTVPVSPVMIVIGGVIVGLGASLGSGCTSGHGVCGLSRLSLRSLVAVPTFMATAAITVFLIRHVFSGGAP